MARGSGVLRCSNLADVERYGRLLRTLTPTLSRFAVEGAIEYDPFSRVHAAVADWVSQSTLILPEQDLAFAADGLVAGEALDHGRARCQFVDAGAAALQA